MRFIPFLIVSFIATFLSFGITQAASDQPVGYFSSDQFADCLAGQISADFPNGKALRSRLREIDRRRHELSREKTSAENCDTILSQACSLIGITLSQQVTRHLRPIGCAVNGMVERGLWFHSAALVDCSEHLTSEKPFMWSLAGYQTSGSNLDRQLNDVDVLQELLRELPELNGYGTSTPQRKCVNDKAEPLIKWLLGQKKNSVSHWQLFQKAREIYGDSFTALGVIGEMFDEERMHCSNRRKKCVLGNRMLPLFPNDTVDNVGYNYHFWAHIAMVLRESAFAERAANYLLECRAGDDGDCVANRMGIEISQKAIRRSKIRIAPANRVIGYADKACEL